MAGSKPSGFVNVPFTRDFGVAVEPLTPFSEKGLTVTCGTLVVHKTESGSGMGCEPSTLPSSCHRNQKLDKIGAILQSCFITSPA